MTVSARGGRSSMGPWVLAAAALLLAGCRGRDVVAKVGRTELRVRDVDQYRHGARSGEQGEAARVVDALVERALLAEAARKAHLDDDPAVRARLDAARREILAQAYADRTLASATREDVLRKRYQDQKERLTRKRVHVRHLVVLFQQGGEDAHRRARSRATAAYARLVGGEPFEKVASEMSDDRATAAHGGDLGPIEEGKVDPAFFEAAAKLKKGELSQPFETRFGWHVAQAVDDPVQEPPTFEEARGRLSAEAFEEARQRLQGELRREIGVKLFPQALADAQPAREKAAAPSP